MGNTADIAGISAPPKPEIFFSHIPSQGVSVGVMKFESGILFSVCFTNTGISQVGKFHRYKRDSFSRRRAREILTGRLLKAQTDLDVAFVWVFLNVPKTLKEFMWAFRERFKAKDGTHFHRLGNIRTDCQVLIDWVHLAITDPVTPKEAPHA